MCWPVKSQLWALRCPTQTGSFPLKLNAQGNMACFAAGNQRMFDCWAWRLMAVCIRLKYGPSKAVAKVNKSRALSRPPSNTSLRNSCYHLAGKTTSIPPAECIWDMWDSNHHTHSFNVVTLAISSPSKSKQTGRIHCSGWSCDLRILFCCFKHISSVIISSGLFCSHPGIWEILRMVTYSFSSEIMFAYSSLQITLCCWWRDTRVSQYYLIRSM